MHSHKVLIGVIFALAIFPLSFLFLKPLFEGVAGEFMFPRVNTPQEENEEEREEEEEVVFSPGPLVKENNSVEGDLTREGVIEETNARREDRDLSALRMNEELNEIAERKLSNMFEKQYFAHISPSGRGVSDISEEVGYDYILIGDNLAKGNYRDDEEVVNAWMNSEGHRKNILEERYEEMGVFTKKGEHEEREVWLAVQVFGMPSSACPEVDESLLERINNKKEEAGEVQNEKENLKEEMDAIEDRTSEEYVKRVEEYNALVKEYNSLVNSLDPLINDYNRQVELRKECINE